MDKIPLLYFLTFLKRSSESSEVFLSDSLRFADDITDLEGADKNELFPNKNKERIKTPGL